MTYQLPGIYWGSVRVFDRLITSLEEAAIKNADM